MKVIENSSGPFNGWGSALTLAGTLMGQPWLGAIGTGMNAIDSMSTGGGGQKGQQNMMGNIDQMLDYMKQAGWINPASGSIAKKGIDTKGLEVLGNLRSIMGGA